MYRIILQGIKDIRSSLIRTHAARYPSAAEREQLVSWVDALTTPAMTNRTIRKLASSQAAASMQGTCTTEEVVSQALQSLNLYLSE